MPTQPTITTIYHDGALQARFACDDGTSAGGSFTVTLSRGHAERELEEAHIALAATGGVVTANLRSHLENHWVRGTTPDGACAWCKLQGRMLAAEGRHRVTSSAARITLVAPGTTRSGLDRAEHDRAARAERAAKKSAFTNAFLVQVPKGLKRPSDEELF